MKVKLLAPLALAAAFGLGTLAPHAQTGAQKIGFVDVSKVLAAIPGNADVVAIKKKADDELGVLDKQARDIQAKGTAATAAEKDTLTKLATTIQSKAKAYDDQIAKLVPPLETKADAAISATAKAQGFSIVMDKQIAAQGLVIYADPSLELTDAAIKGIK